MSVGSGTRMEPDPRKDTATAQGRLLNVMSAHGGKLGQWLSHPVRSVPLAFIAVILMGTGLMMLPIARTMRTPMPASRHCSQPSRLSASPA